MSVPKCSQMPMMYEFNNLPGEIKMNRRIQISAIMCVSVIVIASLGSPFVSEAYAETCVGAGPQICVDFLDAGDPFINDDFIVDFTDPANPDVSLIKGSLYWQVRSRVGPPPNDTPGNIGDITLNPGLPFGDFAVKIAGPTGPGAVDVGSINLVPAGDHYSSLASGSLVSGSVNSAIYGIRVERDSLNNGGVLDITVQGDLSGAVKAWTVPAGATFKVGGTLASCLITIGALGEGGDVGGTIDIERWEGGSGFYVWGRWRRLGSSGLATLSQPYHPERDS